MAYIHGDAYPSVEKQRGGAVLAKAHLAELRRAVDSLEPGERAGFMSEFIGGVIELSESMAAQDGRGGFSSHYQVRGRGQRGSCGQEVTMRDLQ